MYIIYRSTRLTPYAPSHCALAHSHTHAQQPKQQTKTSPHVFDGHGARGIDRISPALVEVDEENNVVSKTRNAVPVFTKENGSDCR